MPKIRGIKPEYWTDEDVVELSIPARLLFIGLWNLACDNGHVADKPKQIKMRILPTDDVNTDALLAEIEAQGRIERDGGWITIHNFAKHQKPHKRWWSTCDQPGCVLPDGCGQPEHNGGSTVAQPGPTVDHGRSTSDVDGDVDSEVDSEGEGDKPRKAARATQIPSDFEPSEANQRYAADNGIDLGHELEQFKNHHAAKGTTFKNWQAGLRTWLGNSKKWAAPQTKPQPVPYYGPAPIPDESELTW